MIKVWGIIFSGVTVVFTACSAAHDEKIVTAAEYDAATSTLFVAAGNNVDIFGKGRTHTVNSGLAGDINAIKCDSFPICFVAGGRNQRGYLASFDSRNNEIISTNNNSDGEVYSIAVSADGSTLYAGTATGSVTKYSSDLQIYDSVSICNSEVFTVFVHSDMSTIFAGCERGQIVELVDQGGALSVVGRWRVDGALYVMQIAGADAVWMAGSEGYLAKIDASRDIERATILSDSSGITACTSVFLNKMACGMSDGSIVLVDLIDFKVKIIGKQKAPVVAVFNVDDVNVLVVTRDGGQRQLAIR